MIVVSDTGPLNYLLRLDVIEVLPQLYGSVVIPEIVRQEMRHPNAPAVVRAWAESLPEWVILRQPQALLSIKLDAGELAAISLAAEMHADLILMDDLRGRQAVDAQNLKIVGTLGILDNAARNSLIDFTDAIAKLRQAGFYVSEAVIQNLLNTQASE